MAAAVTTDSQTHGGFKVKSLWDGFVLAFSSARRALQCATIAQRVFAAHNTEHPEETVLVRVGLHTGDYRGLRQEKRHLGVEHR